MHCTSIQCRPAVTAGWSRTVYEAQRPELAINACQDLLRTPGVHARRRRSCITPARSTRRPTEVHRGARQVRAQRWRFDSTVHAGAQGSRGPVRAREAVRQGVERPALCQLEPNDIERQGGPGQNRSAKRAATSRRSSIATRSHAGWTARAGTSASGVCARRHSQPQQDGPVARA